MSYMYRQHQPPAKNRFDMSWTITTSSLEFPDDVVDVQILSVRQKRGVASGQISFFYRYQYKIEKLSVGAMRWPVAIVAH